MTYIFYIVENIIPQLTQEQRDSYRILCENQILPLKKLWDYQLALCMTTYWELLNILEILINAWKNPSILWAMDINWEDLKDDLGNIIYPRDYTKMQEFLQGSNYNELNIFWGWKHFDYIKD